MINIIEEAKTEIKTKSGIILTPTEESTKESDQNDILYPTKDNILFKLPILEKEKTINGIVIQNNDQKELPNKIVVLAKGSECSDYIEIGDLLMVDIFKQSPVKLMIDGEYVECAVVSEEFVFGKILKESVE